MADLYEPDVGTAYYRSNDPIKNVRFRVTLRRATSANIVPQSTAEDEAGNVELKDMNAQKEASLNDEETISIQWQQKIFSQRELEHYASKENCNDVMELAYHEEVIAVRAKGEAHNRIFTFVDHDKFCNQDETQQYLTTSPSEKPSVLSQKMAHVRRRRVGGKQLREREKNVVPKINVVDQHPTEDFMSRSHLIPSPMQKMYIMADLSNKNRLATERDEYVLCEMVVGANGVLMMRPDFNRGRKAYIIETMSMGREIYEYTIEHDSRKMNRQEQDREYKMYKELYNRHHSFLQACVGAEFEMPPHDTLRLVVFGEIVSARDFEADQLYMHFFLDLPKNWYTLPHQQLSWVTHTCKVKVEGQTNVAYYSFPFSFELTYKDMAPQEDKKESIIRFPQLLVEVMSLDSWSRFNTEGYACFSIPFNPGRHYQRKDCWRPLGTSIVSQLRRFFIGGSPEMEDITYAALPSTFSGNHLSKFGFRTETTGSVDMNLNVVLQSRNFLQKKAKKQSVGAMLDNLGISSVQTNIATVLDAFKKARLKMMQAREAATRELLRETSAGKKDL